MSRNPPLTIIEHNYPRKTEVKNAGDSGDNGNTYNIEYTDINKDQLIALIQRQTCSQALRYGCFQYLTLLAVNLLNGFMLQR